MMRIKEAYLVNLPSVMKKVLWFQLIYQEGSEYESTVLIILLMN